MNVKFEQLNAPRQFTLQASASGSLLLFEGAILARAEVNKNLDEISEEGIRELAATLPMRALDVEHEMRVNCGAFTAAEAVEDPDLGWVLSTAGFMWADRFPQEAAQIQAGQLSLSIEAEADQASCSICGQSFAGARDYCSHLSNQFKSGAVRRMSKLKAVGGGVVRRPAGNGTRFAPTGLRFLASHATRPLEANRMKNCPFCKNTLTEGADACDKCHRALTPVSLAAALAESLDKLAGLETEKSNLVTAADQGKGQIAELEQKLAAAQAAVDAAKAVEGELSETKTKLTAAEAAVTEAQTKLDEAKAEAQAMRASVRRATLGKRITDAEWEAQKDVFMSMTDAAFEVAAKLSGATLLAGIRTDADEPSKTAGAYVCTL